MNDIDHALRELTSARNEIAALNGMSRYLRRAALREPIARLRLVQRFLDQVIEANEP